MVPNSTLAMSKICDVSCKAGRTLPLAGDVCTDPNTKLTVCGFSRYEAAQVAAAVEFESCSTTEIIFETLF